MERRRLGSTDLWLPRLGFGAAPLGDEYGPVDDAMTDRLVRAAIDAGVTWFDTSPYYGRGLSERRLGRALRGVRDQVVLGTKAGRNGRDHPEGFDFSAAGIRASIEGSLGRLGVDHLDLVLLHDIEFGRREQVLEEALPALEEARERGQVRYVGVSGLPLPVLIDAVGSARLDAVLSYCHGDLLDRGVVDELVPVAAARGVGVITASPLHMGLLGPLGPPPWHPAGPERRADAAAVVARCAELGVSPVAAALGFAAGLPGPASVLCGMATLDQLRADVEALVDPVDPAVLAELAAIPGSAAPGRWPSGIR